MTSKGDFKELQNLYDSGDFTKILDYSNGMYFLKLRSMSRPTLLKKLAEQQAITIFPKPKLFDIFNQNIPLTALDKFIRKEAVDELKNIADEKEILYTELFKLDVLDWGGLYQNGLEKTIVNNYVKKIKNYDELNQKITNELHDSMSGYVKSSWYNHWSTILIENMFQEHKNIIPAIGKVKNLDFFWNDIPLDLKVTYFPKEFLNDKRKELGLRTELSSLKKFAKESKICYDKNGNDRQIFTEIYRKLSESSKPEYLKFIKELKQKSTEIINNTIKDPVSLAQWLYEKQSERRFDRVYRFYLILIDSTNLEDSWKLKRNRDLVPNGIKSFLSKDPKKEIKDIKFGWKDKEYDTKCFVLFIVKS